MAVFRAITVAVWQAESAVAVAARRARRAAQELADRVEGRPRQSVEIQHTALREAFERMTREELEAYAACGTLPEWFPEDEESTQ